MAPFAPPIPGTPPPPDVANLVAPPVPVPSPSPQDRISNYMNQVRELHMTLDALATSHPEASEDLNTAKVALTNSMSKVASASASPNAIPQPPAV